MATKSRKKALKSADYQQIARRTLDALVPDAEPRKRNAPAKKSIRRG